MFGVGDLEPVVLGTSESLSSSLPRQQRSAKLYMQPQDSTAAWTATRCHRLLRPLLSSIASLRREKKIWDAARPGSYANEPAAGPQESPPIFPHISVNGPGRPRKMPPKVTYSRKRTTMASPRKANPADDLPASQTFTSKTLVSSEAVMPTPVVRKIRNSLPSSPVVPPVVAFGIKPPRPPMVGRELILGRAPVEAELSALRLTTPPSKFAIYESIVRAFDPLLRATTNPSGGGVVFTSAAASKSLLAMCLRKVPEYISGRQMWECEEAEARGDKVGYNESEVSLKIYSDLENIGAGDGWKHLRTVVRAHGVKEIRDAAYDSLFDNSFSRILVRLCLNSGAHEEAEQILLALTSRQFPGPKSPQSFINEKSGLAPVILMRAYATDATRSFFLLRRLADCLSSGMLPEDWLLGEDLMSLWPTAVRSISSSSSSCEAAIIFAISSINIFCDNISRKRPMPLRKRADDVEFRAMSERALIASLAAFVSMLAVGHEEAPVHDGKADNHSVATERRSIISRRVRYILHSCLVSQTKKRRGFTYDGAYLLVLSLYLSGVDNLPHDSRPRTVTIERLENFWEDPDGQRARQRDKTQQYDRTVALISAIAQCCARGSASPSSNYLTLLCGMIQGLNVTGDPFRRLQVDGAFHLADKTNDLRDLAYAETLDSPSGLSAAGKPGGVPTHAPSASTMFKGYCWDEGISEWVMESDGVGGYAPGEVVLPMRSPYNFEKPRSSRAASPAEANSGKTSSSSITGAKRSRTSMEDDESGTISSAPQAAWVGNRPQRRRLLRGTASEPSSSRASSVASGISLGTSAGEEGLSLVDDAPTEQPSVPNNKKTSRRASSSLRRSAQGPLGGDDRKGGPNSSSNSSNSSRVDGHGDDDNDELILMSNTPPLLPQHHQQQQSSSRGRRSSSTRHSTSSQQQQQQLQLQLRSKPPSTGSMNTRRRMTLDFERPTSDDELGL